MNTELQKLNEAIEMFTNRIESQGMVTDARDEEHLSQLKQARETFIYGPNKPSKELKTLVNLSNTFGYWSDEVKEYNGILHEEKGFDFMTDTNTRCKGILRDTSSDSLTKHR